jgi:hypothetical protein
MDTSPTALRKLYDSGYGMLGTWRDQWEEIALYTIPGKADFITERSPGSRDRTRRIYDSTALVSNHTLASHMHTAMTSPAAPWFELAFGDPDMNKQDKPKEWLEDSTRRMFSAINDSNFVSIINELYQDIIAFGTACIEVTYIVDPQDGFKLVFRSMDVGKLVFHENVYGVVDCIQYEQRMTISDVKLMFPDKTFEFVEDKKDKPSEKVKLLRSIVPNDKYDPKSMKSDRRKYVSVWQYKTEELEREGYYENPYMTPRWSKMTIEPYGYGPGLLALPDIKTLNEAKRLELRSWEKAIDPPLLAMANGVIGDINLEAGRYTQVRDTRALTPLADQANWSAVQIKSQELRTNIQAVYLIDQLILPERPNATATEVQIRYEMMQRVLGPTMGRLQSELLNPMVDRIFNIMHRNGKFADMPREISGAETEVKYTGPLSRAQTSNDAVAIEKLINALMALAEMSPEAMDVIDLQRATQALARQWGVPADVLRSDKEIEEINAQRQQQAQMQAQQEQQMNQMQMQQQQAETSAASVNAMQNLRAMGG